MAKQQYIEAGKIINTHGVAGEVKIEVWLDSPEFLKKFKRYYLDGVELSVESARVHKGFLLAKLKGVDTVEAAMALKTRTIYIARGDAGLPKGGYFLSDIFGASVVDEEGRPVGELTDVMETPASPVYVVTGESEHLIPAVPEFILNVDTDAGIVKVHLIEGM